MGNEEVEAEVNRWVVLVMGTSSLLAASLVVFSILKWKKLRPFPSPLVLMLALCDIGLSVVYITKPIVGEDALFKDKTFCTINGFLDQLFILPSILWSGTIAMNFFLVVVKNRSNTKWLFRYSNIFFWPISFGCAIATVATDMIRPAGMWCWISNSNRTFRLAFCYVPAWAVMFFTLFATSTTLRKLRKDRVGFFRDERRSIHIRLISMVIVFFLIWVFITILRGYEFQGEKSPYIFVLSTYIFVPGRGLFDALVFWFITPKFRQQWYEVFECCGKKSIPSRSHHMTEMGVFPSNAKSKSTATNPSRV